MNNLTKTSDNTHENDDYVFFWSSYLSNWAMCKIDIAMHSFNCAEQALMWYKAMMFDDAEIASKIYDHPDPRRQKAFGRQVRNFKDEVWDKYKFEIMVEILEHKFLQNEDMKRKLLATGSKIICESSPDKIWGIGVTAEFDDILDETKWKGQNLLGKALMTVRERIRNINDWSVV